ncbi:pilus assembly protein [Frateuria aurantia]|uniref:Tfp pilus assembly protein, tip-associated adhesin PilY1 n=1 Tax=Frateuria aurantia (strain ATCC 33424 / DSM 6220 / KCTC 2777 / LMG 1558 / NBRC 3245 / NCIMB 13370) TaxID=767434 RepID=H8L4L5_FRAAD|nr:PilC/PilY family type IV pilus protein [Frateuria aurantia]AFC86570.1 Tfp pilus assembly protein, tip-associated adhesin PilY1 [Frateuria aurantia DSM 6220]
MSSFAGVCRLSAQVLVALVLAMFSGSALLANTVTISSTPPSVTTRVAPNIVVTFDDSGSMNSTSIPDSMDGEYNQSFYYSSSYNPLYFNPDITYTVPPPPPGGTMVVPTYTHAPRDGYCASLVSAGCWSPNNGSYLTPAYQNLSTSFYTGYLSNVYAGNSPCPRDANEPGGWYNTSNGVCSQLDIPASLRGTVTVTSTVALQPKSGSCYRGFFSSDCPPEGTFTNNGTTTTTTISCSFLICSYTTTGTTTTTTTTTDPGGFYYSCSSTSNCTYHSLANASDAVKANFAIWYSYYRTRNLMARGGIGRVFGSLGDSAVRVGWQTLQSQTASSAYNTSAGQYQGLAYGPLTLLGSSAPSGILPLVNASTGCSSTTISSDSCWRSKFMNWVYGVPASGSTPTRVALQTVAKFYGQKLSATSNATRGAAPLWNDSTSTPTELACRKNFNMLVTDGYWNADSPSTPTVRDSTSTTLPDNTAYTVGQQTSAVYWNESSSFPASLANIAFSGWATNLRPDLLPQNNVPAYYPDLTTGVTASTASVSSTSPGSNREVYFNPANDPATWQHISQYMVTLGATGTLTNNAATLLALRTGQQAWPTPTTAGGATNIDDTWHAALNSRGGYFSASDPTTLYNSLSTILASVIASSSSSLNVSLNAQTLTSNSVAYLAGYNTTSWTGTLAAESVGATGVIGANLWEAGSLLTKRDLTSDPRVLVTTSGPGAGTGIAFNWSGLSSSEQAILNSPDGSGGSSDGNGSARVSWLSGVRSSEGTLFRSRTSLLGPIFNAQPVYVGAPSAGLSNTFPSGSPEALALASSSSYAYSNFVSTYASRQGVLYAAANDGMLHAFDARTSGGSPGRELWGFLPSSVYANLPAQTKLNSYSFTPTVDGTPVQGDVFFSASGSNGSSKGWHTILVGGLRYGGRGIYAIDVTDPAAMTSTSAVAGKILWEFNSSSTASNGAPANLGYTFGTPTIGRLANGLWVVLVPGGYFPDNSTAAAASNTYSSLFVLNAQTGALIKEIRTPSGVTSYGLSTVVLGDYNGDQVADVGFAGDLAGNLWRFDFSSANLSSTSQTAGVSRIYAPTTVAAQSITTQPRLVADPTSSYFMVIFGTGRFLSTADTADTTVQGIVAVRDPGNSTATAWTLPSLVQQTLSTSSTGVIGVSSNAVPATAGGWYVLLNQTAGERVVVNPYLQLSTDAVVFTTLIPATSDPCTTALGGSILELDATTGTAALGNNFSGTGLASGFTAAGSHISGAASAGSLSGATGSGGTVYFPGTTTSGTTTSTVSINGATRRRRSWRILNNYEN